MKFKILTIFPDMIRAGLGESILGRAIASGAIEAEVIDIRPYSQNRHKNTDDTPYGGGMGMLMAAPPIVNCFEAICGMQPANVRRHVVYLSPRGQVFNHAMAKRFAEYDNLVLLCGHYEGVDARVLDLIVDEEVSIGDFVLTGGELPACIVTDAVARLCPGVLSDDECYENESIAGGLLEYPQYTRPFDFRGLTVPDVLISGHHENIDKWRLAQSVALTRERRPDLYAAWLAEHPDNGKGGKKR